MKVDTQYNSIILFGANENAMSTIGALAKPIGTKR